MSNSYASKTTSRRTRPRRVHIATTWPRARSCRSALRALLAAPLTVRFIVGAAVVLALWSAANGTYQVIRKPSELFFPLSSALSKTPSETWRQYEPLFREHSTSIITPDLLAALAQVEGGGNAVAHTYWQWHLTWNPLELYRPASSAVGMYQITDATFRDGKRYCIRNHAVFEDGPWNDWRSCWFNSLYTRVVPSHAVELTSAHLHHVVVSTLQRQRIASTTLQQQQNLAAVIHLCGAGAADAYAKRGFRSTASQLCGHHDVRSYLAQVNAMKHVFVSLATGSTPSSARLAMVSKPGP